MNSDRDEQWTMDVVAPIRLMNSLSWFERLFYVLFSSTEISPSSVSCSLDAISVTHCGSWPSCCSAVRYRWWSVSVMKTEALMKRRLKSMIKEKRGRLIPKG
ncbi:unnamed protein product [Lathyrus oleraceus]